MCDIPTKVYIKIYGEIDARVKVIVCFPLSLCLPLLRCASVSVDGDALWFSNVSSFTLDDSSLICLWKMVTNNKLNWLRSKQSRWERRMKKTTIFESNCFESFENVNREATIQ